MQDQHLRFWIDLASLSAVVTTLMGWLPSIAALFSIVWIGIQIFEWDKHRDKQTKQDK